MPAANGSDLIGITGEFVDDATETAFSASAWRPARAMALLCILGTTAASLSFLPLDFLTVPLAQLPLFLGARLLIALVAVTALVAVMSTERFARIVVIVHAQQFAFFTLNALVFDHPSLTRHGGLLLPLVALSLNLFLPGRFRLVALTSAYAAAISLLFWAVLRPDPERPLDLSIILLVVLVGYAVGAVARTQFNRLRREEYLRIARERHVNIDLREAKDAAETAARAKADFLAVMSHEIRTPMNGILGMVQLALDEPMPQAQRSRLSIIKSSAEGLLTILDDILDISKLELRDDVYERSPFDLRQAMREVINLMIPRAREKGLTLHLTISPAIPAFVAGDVSRIRQVLFNLISNALKFTQEGGVTVDVAASGQTVGGGAIVFSVSDTGIGISDEQKAHLFQPFEQADASIRRRFGGTGLGLAICKRLVEGMKGEIDVDSRPGQGSRFHFTLPLPAAEAPAQAGPAEAAGVLPRPLNLLLVEDLPVNAVVARGILEKAGHRVALAKSGAQAIALARSASFDGILMDMQMPDLDGLEATRRIRALGAPFGEVPIIALTANAMAQDVAACLAAGMDGHLAKPIDAAALHATINDVVGRKRSAAPRGAHGALAPGGDVLVVGDEAKRVHGPLAGLGFRIFPALSFEAAETMLSARGFSALVAISPPSGFLKRVRERAARDGRQIFLLAAPADPDGATRLLDEGADVTLTADRLADDVALKFEAFLAPTDQRTAFELEEVFERERIDELRGLFATSLVELDQALAKEDLAPEELAGIAHRIKGSAANMRMQTLAHRAEDAFAAAKAVVSSLAVRRRAVTELRQQISDVVHHAEGLQQSGLHAPSLNMTEAEEDHVDSRIGG